MNLQTVAISASRTLVYPSSSLSLPAVPFSFVFRERDLHTHDLKARKLARLPGDKCRREEDSHADISDIVPSLSLSLAPFLLLASSFWNCGSLVTSCTRSRSVYVHTRVHSCLRASADVSRRNAAHTESTNTHTRAARASSFLRLLTRQ